MHTMLIEPTVNAIDRLTAERAEPSGSRYFPTDEELTPAYRAKKLRAAMDELYDEAASEDALTDVLADARHFADAHGLEFAKQDRLAQAHYIAEIEAAVS